MKHQRIKIITKSTCIVVVTFVVIWYFLVNKIDISFPLFTFILQIAKYFVFYVYLAEFKLIHVLWGLLLRILNKHVTMMYLTFENLNFILGVDYYIIYYIIY